MSNNIYTSEAVDEKVYDAIEKMKTYTDNIVERKMPLYNTNSDDLISGYIYYYNGTVISPSTLTYVEICVKDISSIIYNYTMTSPDNRGLAFYDENYIFISGIQISTTSQTISVPDNAYYCRATVKSLEQLIFNTDVNELNKNIQNNNYSIPLYNTDENAYVENAYVSYGNGEIGTASQCDLITCCVYNVDSVIYKSRMSSPDLRGLAFYDENETFISGVQIASSVQTISVPDGAYYCKASVYNSNDLLLNIDGNWIVENISPVNNKFDKISSNDNLLSSGYIYYGDGKIIEHSSLTYVSLYVHNLETIEYNYVVSTTDNRGLAFYDENYIFISGVQTSSSVQTIDVPSNAYYCRATVDDVSKIVINSDPTYFSSETNYILNRKPYNILSAFNNITCIGDSLTYSQVYTSSSTSRQAYQTYPNCIEKQTGTTTTGIATAGADCIYWWTYHADELESKTNQLAIIYLGTNNGLTDTIDDDCVGDDYTDWADTNTGCYAKIISRCLELDMKVLLLKVWTTSGDSLDTTNDVISQLGAMFGCAVVEPIKLIDTKYYYFPDLSGYGSVHLNDLGYSAFANKLIEKISLLDDDEMKLIIPN